MSANGMQLPEGTILHNRYIIGQRKGNGGFGITYKAHDRYNQAECAIKEYFPGMIATRAVDKRVMPVSQEKRNEFEHGRSRFVDEARTLRRLNNYENIVQITDYFDENATSYFVMEYIDGVNLKELARICDSRIPVKDALDILKPICRTLDALHTKEGIFHRDISPENIMITPEGDVKLVDFGNARNIGQQLGYSVVLKQGFAPVEQYSKKGVQGSYTDLYALAATFYYAMTGVLVPTAPERVSGATYVPLSQMLPNVPTSVSDAFDRALMVKAADRTQTVQEFMKQAFNTTSGLRLAREPATGGRPVPYIEVMDGPMKGQQFEMQYNTVAKIGRSKIHTDFCLGDDLRLSKVHCQVYYDYSSNCYQITDCSTNGIYLNDAPLRKNVAETVPANTILMLGNHVCRIKVGVRYV